MLLLSMSGFHQRGGWARLFHSCAQREHWVGAVGISSTQALVYVLLTALYLHSIFNSFNPDT